MHLPLGSMHLPLNAATKIFAILAKRGAGKSYTGARILRNGRNIQRFVFCCRRSVTPEMTGFRICQRSVRH